MNILRSKRGALNLSINAIVVLIIAIVFLGLALTFTRNLLNQSSDKLITGIDNVDISTPADADRPITVDGRLEVKKNGKKLIKVSFYNSGNEKIMAQPRFTMCVDDDGKSITDLPSLGAISINVTANSEERFQATLKAGKLNTGSYICNLNIADANLQVPVTIKS